MYMPRAAPLFYSLRITNHNFKIKEKFLASVAKGMKSTLGSSVTVSDQASFSASVEADFLTFVKAKVHASYGISFFHTVDAHYEFQGPPEESTYNSRSYYVAIVNDVGYYKVWKQRSDKKIVKFRAPKSYVIYSVDASIH